jgi:hypothetical protein
MTRKEEVAAVDLETASNFADAGAAVTSTVEVESTSSEPAISGE